MTDAASDREPWFGAISTADWPAYAEVIALARARHIPFAVGGGVAYAVYAERRRPTKDLDLYVLPRDRQRMINVVTDRGFEDYYDRVPYDRAWIYRASRDELIVDVIWASANHHQETDEAWLTAARREVSHAVELPILPVEEFVWSKLYVFQRERCDWPDLLNVLRGTAGQLRWDHLLARVGPDTALLGGLLAVFGWMCSAQARQIPAWVWERVKVCPPVEGPDCERDGSRVRLLDSRDWFGAQSAPAEREGSTPC
jgi:hypothetical protein